jgi:hypothetical protein
MPAIVVIGGGIYLITQHCIDATLLAPALPRGQCFANAH